jgi:hypothetical protein
MKTTVSVLWLLATIFLMGTGWGHFQHQDLLWAAINWSVAILDAYLFVDSLKSNE